MKIIHQFGFMSKHIPEKASECAPRSRPSSAYPGGKHLRKAQARLAARRQAQEETRAELRRKPKSVPESAFAIPGSMK